MEHCLSENDCCSSSMQSFVVLQERILGLNNVIHSSDEKHLGRYFFRPAARLLTSSFLSGVGVLPWAGLSAKATRHSCFPKTAVTTPLALICALRGLSATAQGRVAPVIVDAPLPHDPSVASPAAQLVFWDLQAIASRGRVW